MVRMSRSEVLATDEVVVAHVFARTVRRCFLFGTDAASGKNFDHRKLWIEAHLQHFAAATGLATKAPAGAECIPNKKAARGTQTRRWENFIAVGLSFCDGVLIDFVVGDRGMIGDRARRRIHFIISQNVLERTSSEVLNPLF